MWSLAIEAFVVTTLCCSLLIYLRDSTQICKFVFYFHSFVGAFLVAFALCQITVMIFESQSQTRPSISSSQWIFILSASGSKFSEFLANGETKKSANFSSSCVWRVLIVASARSTNCSTASHSICFGRFTVSIKILLIWMDVEIEVLISEFERFHRKICWTKEVESWRHQRRLKVLIGQIGR